jgi:circadian clock protein KaiC
VKGSNTRPYDRAMSALTMGIKGLDEILLGGLPENHAYLIEGSPGAGKTTLAMQFLLEGARVGQRSMYISLSETAEELRASARSHGWSMDGVEIREYVINDTSVERDREVTMYHTPELELGDTMARMLKDIREVKPERVVIDALTELRLLSDSVLRYRRQLLALKKFFNQSQCTVLMLDDRATSQRDSHVESIVHGVIALEFDLTEYGSDRRRLRVRKMRGRSFLAGLHDYNIRTGGLEVFPRLIAARHVTQFERSALPSGLAELDQLLGGGPQFGTSTLLIGPAGSGKTTVSMQFALSAVKGGHKVAIYLFDELRDLLIDRFGRGGMDLTAALAGGAMTITQIDPTQKSPGEFAAQVRADVEHRGARVVVIDSLNGYLNAMPHEEFLTAQLHELLAYLGNRGVVTFLVVAQRGIMGANMSTPVDASYLADSIVLFRYFEMRGEVRKAISVAKKRGGPHENAIRELTVNSQGIHVGEPLSEFQGVLTGVPSFLRGEEPSEAQL